MRICIIGSSGRMGLELIKLISQNSDLTLSGEINNSTQDSEALNYLDKSDIIIDFSLPNSTQKYLKMAVDKKIAYVIGTTGFNEEQEKLIQQTAQKIAIVKSGNMSLGVNILANLVKQTNQILQNQNFDISIVEMHHKHKRDKPSGTALLLGDAALQANDNTIIEYNSLRGGTVIGDHEVIFAGDNEKIVLSHFAQDRKIFAIGALKAALWLHKRDAGLYNMQDVLNLK